MDLRPIQARLLDQVTDLSKVAGFTDFFSDVSGSTPAPCSYVLPASYSAGANEFSTTAIQQRISETFVVVTAFSALGDSEETNELTELEALLNKVRRALLGWQPAAGYDPIILVSGDAVNMANGVIWWQDVFQTSYYLRSF